MSTAPDGRFAFNMGKSLILDPEHTYLRQESRGLAWWGIGLPLLFQPALILGSIIDPLMPQKDIFGHEGRDYLIGEYPVLAPRGAPNALETLPHSNRGRTGQGSYHIFLFGNIPRDQRWDTHCHDHVRHSTGGQILWRNDSRARHGGVGIRPPGRAR